eukprot:CAMPEP_0205813732 /NCGR_PEP_ID=MMETSP0205-20121125/18470_1 /ASSEMBLY_ACC=CAM_ASM_000278 /TAXON_ID=36767 /ORGANISM="Euplotes focardii, Strain TN1" /LENGTH=65 /DNA_ID=CAMNT_0053096273 /DNA_START=95 /DNA_END=292 /DNA_ORIENTATION=+
MGIQKDDSQMDIQNSSFRIGSLIWNNQQEEETQKEKSRDFCGCEIAQDSPNGMAERSFNDHSIVS